MKQKKKKKTPVLEKLKIPMCNESMQLSLHSLVIENLHLTKQHLTSPQTHRGQLRNSCINFQNNMYTGNMLSKCAKIQRLTIKEILMVSRDSFHKYLWLWEFENLYHCQNGYILILVKFTPFNIFRKISDEIYSWAVFYNDSTLR